MGSEQSERTPKVIIHPLPPCPPAGADCSACTASCQSACKTSCTVGNQACPAVKAPPESAPSGP